MEVNLIDQQSFEDMVRLFDSNSFDYDLAIHSLSYGPEVVSFFEENGTFKLVCYNCALESESWIVESKSKEAAVLGAIWAHSKDNGDLFWEVYTANKLALDTSH